MIAPSRIGGRAAATRVRAVDDVVVDKSRAVEKFDDRGEPNGAAIRAACMASGEKQESGAQTLPAAAQEIGGDFGDRRKGGFALPREFLLDQHEVVADQIKNLFDRQQGDCASPELTLFIETRGRNTR